MNWIGFHDGDCGTLFTRISYPKKGNEDEITSYLLRSDLMMYDLALISL
jgi:hypothetical protein